MLFKEFGSKDKKAVVLLHGGGLSWWQWEAQISALEGGYRVIVPVIDGHGEDCGTEFVSIQDSAQKLMDYIQKECSAKVFAICGLSLGAQITVEVLARQEDIAQYALIESALTCPMKNMHRLTKLIYGLSYPLISKRWFANMQAKSLFMQGSMFEKYYADSSKMSKQSLINIALSNSSYPVPEALKGSRAQTLILVGGREIQVMKKSAHLLKETINGSTLKVLDNYGHGEISIKNPEEYIKVFSDFTAG